METTIRNNYTVTGMSCASCAASVGSMLKSQPGIIEATVNYASSSVWVEYQSGVIDPMKMRSVLQSIGYDLLIGEEESKNGDKRKEQEISSLKQRTFYAGLLALPVVLIGMWGMELPGANWVMLLLSTPVVLWFGRGFFINAWKQLKHGKANMDTLVALSTGIAYLFSLFNTIFPHWQGEGAGHALVYYEAAATIIVFILLGRWLEERAKASTSSAIKKLMGLQPDQVTLVETDGTERLVPVAVVVVGDRLRVKPGDRIPVDGMVQQGSSFVDESTITGEPIAAEKGPGEQVYAGTINQKGSFVMEAARVGSETLLSRIIRMVQQAQDSKPPVQHLVDKVASIFVPVVIVVAVITFGVWMVFGGPNPLPLALLTMVSVLIIACPCALGLATPTAIMVGIGRGAQLGILIKDADGLEQAHRIDTLVLDKTGTITEGKPAVTDWFWNARADEEIKGVLLAMEQQSEHPLAEAIVRSMKEIGVKPVAPDRFESRTGQGVIATWKNENYSAGNERLLQQSGILLTEKEQAAAQHLQQQARTVVYFAGSNGLLAMIAIADPIKPTSGQAIRQLKERGIEVIMLTGDNEQTARSVAQQTGITNFKAGLQPEDKARIIEELQQQGRVVAMAGDGINDSHAMAQADVSIAMGSGADIAMEVAKMTIVSSNLASIATAIQLSKETIRTIRQNLFWAFIYNVIGIPVAAGVLFPFTGFLLNPMIAGAAMSLSSVSVVSNSLRLKFKKLIH